MFLKVTKLVAKIQCNVLNFSLFNETLMAQCSSWPKSERFSSALSTDWHHLLTLAAVLTVFKGQFFAVRSPSTTHRYSAERTGVQYSSDCILPRGACDKCSSMIKIFDQNFLDCVQTSWILMVHNQEVNVFVAIWT